MSMTRTVWKALAGILVLSLLSGCSMFGGNTITVPTQDTLVIQSTLDAAKTQAVQTVVADLTLNAPVATNTLPPTETTAPTQTSAPINTLAPSSTVMPAATLAPTFTSTATRVIVVVTNTPAPSNTPTSIACTQSDVVPAIGADFAPSAPFDAGWTIKNTSSNNWSTNEIDIRYLSGTKMHEGADNRDLPSDIAANGTFRLLFDMNAPTTAGRYSETWALTQGGLNLCVMTVTIDVVP